MSDVVLGIGSHGQVEVCSEHDDCAVKKSKGCYGLNEMLYFSHCTPDFFPKIIEFRAISAQETEIHMEKFDSVLIFGSDREKSLEAVKAVGLSLLYLHRRGLAHRDIKETNILCKKGRTVLTDFTLTEPTETKCHANSGYCPPFRAPECWNIHEVDTSSDVFAFGVLLYYACGGGFEFDCEDVSKEGVEYFYRECRKLGLFSSKINDPLFEKIEKPLADLILSCIAYSPHDRPTITKVLEQLGVQIPEQVAAPSFEISQPEWKFRNPAYQICKSIFWDDGIDGMPMSFVDLPAIQLSMSLVFNQRKEITWEDVAALMFIYANTHSRQIERWAIFNFCEKMETRLPELLKSVNEILNSNALRRMNYRHFRDQSWVEGYYWKYHNAKMIRSF
ncbi:protein kinase [Pithovirus sibericum]|uniref:Protein kinase n=1 Tax=Pithovirus sibericum TaxID=1450746 RepID=W5S4Z2_9VIRU|nr:protein kinase [Pithovirus sibericum]AHH01724.1 protein kinase [Pithovirus sibericum]